MSVFVNFGVMTSQVRFVPSDVPGLVMELYGTNLTGADDDLIAAWPDPFAGSGLAQGTALLRPVKKTNILNTSLSVARGAGAQCLVSAAPVTTNTGYTIFAVVKQTTGGTTQVFLCNGTTSASGYGFFITSGGDCRIIHGGIADATIGTESGNWEIWGARFDGVTAHTRISGNVEFDVVIAAPSAPATRTAIIGEDSSNFLIGDMFAGLIYNNDIGATNFDRVFSYLSTLTGIAE